MKTEAAYRIRDLVRGNPQEIRVLCPRGHFIAQVGLYVPEQADPDTAPIRMHPRGPNKQYVGNLAEGHHGFRMDVGTGVGGYRVTLSCTNKRCRYSGFFNFVTLGVDLAAQALAGHAEYRLIL